MRRGDAALLVLVLAALTALPLLPWTPWWVAAAEAAGATLLMRRRTGFLLALGVGAAIQALVLAVATPGATAVALGPVHVGADGAVAGAVAALRLGAAAGVNMAVLQRLDAAVPVEALRPPRRLTAWLAALLLAMQDVGQDFARLRDALRLRGRWPARRAGRVRAAAALCPPLLLLAAERARVRAEALRFAGITVGPRFAPIVAVAALAMAGRLVLATVPNVSLAYVVVFTGGMVFGARVGAAAGALAMLATDVMLSGLLPLAFVNVPAMALVGAAGALVRRVGGRNGEERAAAVVAAACAGFVATMLFSVAADTGTWLLVPELRGDWDRWQALVVAGLAFNVLPAATNAAAFALVVGPTANAMVALRPAAHQQREDHQGTAA